MQTMTELIHEFICKNPGATNVEIANALSLDATRVAALTGQMCKPTAGAGPRLRREEHPTRKASGNRPIYTHFATDVTFAKRTREREVIQKPVSAKVQPLPQIGNLIDTIGKQIANQIVESVGKHLAVQLALVIPEQPAQQFDLVQYLKEAIVPVKQEQPVARAPRVTIVGLLPQQAGMISSEFGQFYDLSFWKEEGVDRLKSLCKNADHIITFSGKLGHQVENTIRSTNREFKRVMGGMTELRRVLNELGS